MKILYVEDNPGDAKLLQYEFAESASSIEIDWAATCAEAREEISRCTPDAPCYDLILTDMQLPDGKGVSLLPVLQECGLQIPLVVITGLEDMASAISALKAGASDYLVKTDRYLADLPGILQDALARYQTEITRHTSRFNVLYGTNHPQDIELSRKHFVLYAPFIHLEIVSTAQAVLKKLTARTKDSKCNAENSCDVLLLADLLPDMDSLVLLREIRTVRKIDIPIVMISSEGNYELAMQSLRMGADDYITKSSGYLYYLPNALENAFNRLQVEREREALKKSEKYFRMLIENSSDIIVVSDFNGAIRYCSSSIERFLGYKHEELIRMNILEKIHPDDLLDVGKKLEKAFQYPGNTIGPVEYRFYHADGSCRWLEILGRVISDLSGEQVGVFNGRDITERKTAEQELLTSQLRLREAMELAQLVYWEADPVENQFIFNDPFYAFLATTAEAEGGYRMTMTDYAERFVHPDDHDLLYRFKEEIERTWQEYTHLESRVIRRDGEIRHVLTRAHYLRDESGRITYILGANQDITERKNMEMALQESESKYRSLVENPLVGTYINQGSRIQFANKRFFEIVGYTADEVFDKMNLLDIVHPNDRDMVKNSLRRFLKDQIPIKEDIQIIKNDGKTISVKNFVSPITYLGKLAAAGIMIDTTTEKSLENQLRQSHKMEAIGTLAGGIAHDFNNILTALTGYGSLLKMEMESGGSPQMSYVDAILSSALKASNLTQSLLSFARQQTVTLKYLSINVVVTGMQKMLMRLLTEDIVLQTNLTSESTFVAADESQIDQILINLAVNARDAMPKGGIITLETATVDLDAEAAEYHGLEEAGRYIILSVSDTGIGMDADTKEHIFEPFFTTKAIGKGTGLGLATVYGIVKQHHGSIIVYSEKGMGSVFHIYLPAVDEQTGEVQQKPALVGGTETILLAEDDSYVRDSMATLLTRFGYTVIQAVDGQNAIECFNAKRNSIDILIFDSVMPQKNGREAYDEISARHPSMKVIFMSGYTRDILLDKGIEEKRFDFLIKPISHDILLGKVREVLDR
ncbi:MAG: PAS domain S-box protein [Smithellaceae bacterium]